VKDKSEKFVKATVDTTEVPEFTNFFPPEVYVPVFATCPLVVNEVVDAPKVAVDTYKASLKTLPVGDVKKF